MDALQAIKKQLNVTHTENGDLAYKSTNNSCLDLYSLCGGMRNNVKDLDLLFAKAFGEDPKTAIKILFHMRNIRGGLGERKTFRLLLLELAKYYPDVVEQVLYAVPKYGRWDDLLVLLNTKVEDKVIELVNTQIELDKAAMVSGKEVSLLGKWLPSINTSSSVAKARAKRIASALGMKAVEYRKLCSALRKEIKILENNLREKDYTFDYSKQPSQAMFKHKKAFIRNDNERYTTFLKKVAEQTAKIAAGEEIPEEEKVKLNVKTLYPYQIVAPFIKACPYQYSLGNLLLSDNEILPLEVSWKALPRENKKSRTIVVRDGSGSMYDDCGDFSAINVATSLALLFAEQLDGVYKNSFITFSSSPQLIQIPDNAETLLQKIGFINRYDDCSNTNISKVYELLYNVAVYNEVPSEEAIDRVLIISDMEFDNCDITMSTFEYYKQKFEEAGYTLPEIVFWNVRGRSNHVPVMEDEKGVKLVSGASASIFTDVMNDDLKAMTPYEFMIKTLEPYSEFDDIKLGC